MIGMITKRLEPLGTAEYWQNIIRGILEKKFILAVALQLRGRRRAQ